MLWLALLLSMVDRLIWPPIMPIAAKELGMAGTELGSYMAAFYAGYVVTQLPGGLLVDRFGYRKVLITSFFIMSFFTVAMGFVKTFEQGLLFRTLAGVGSGAIFPACTRAIFDWFPPKRRGTAMGFFMTASSIGITIVNLFVPTIASSYTWQASFILAGSFSLFAGGLAFFLLQERTEFKNRQKTLDVCSFLKDIKILLGNRNLMITGFSGFFAMWATWGAATWANMYMNNVLKLSLIDAGLFMTAFGVAAMLCKPISGIISDIINIKKQLLLFWMFLSFGAIIILFGINTNIYLLYIITPLLGIAAFMYSPVMNTYIGELVDSRLVGSATGLINAIWQMGSLISPLVVGSILDGTNNYLYAFTALGIGPMIGAFIILGIREG